MKKQEAVVHLAGVAGERLCKENLCRAVFSNVGGTHNLLQEAISQGVQHFIFSSSYWAYSFFDERPLPLKEVDELKTDSFYGALKASSEQELLSSRDRINITILRLATVYGYGAGVGAQWRGLIGRYIEAVHQGKPQIVYGKGTQKIDFVHIDDIIRAISTFVKNTGSGCDSIFNLGGGKAVSILDIAQLVSCLSSEEFGRKGEIVYQPPPPGKIWPDRWLSIDRIKRIMPDYPTIGLENGIREMMRKYIERQVAATKRSCRSGKQTKKSSQKEKLLRCNSTEKAP
jgi:UDP-glucose 4-epimerase